MAARCSAFSDCLWWVMSCSRAMNSGCSPCIGVSVKVHRAQDAVAPADQHFARAARVRGPSAAQAGAEQVEVFLRDRGASKSSSEEPASSSGVVAEVAVAGRVGVLDAPIRFDHHQALVHAVDDQAQALGLLLLRQAAAAELELGAHAGAHLGQAQRLGDVVGRADVEAGDDVLGARSSRS
jgi:hypothetical protein